MNIMAVYCLNVVSIFIKYNLEESLFGITMEKAQWQTQIKFKFLYPTQYSVELTDAQVFKREE